MQSDTDTMNSVSRRVFVIGIGMAGVEVVGRFAAMDDPAIVPVGICSSEAVLEVQRGIQRVLVGTGGRAVGGGDTIGDIIPRIGAICAGHTVFLVADLGDLSTHAELEALAGSLKTRSAVVGILAAPWNGRGCSATLRAGIGTWTILPTPWVPAEETLFWALRAGVALAREGEPECNWLNDETLGTISLGRVQTATPHAAAQASIDAFRRAAAQLPERQLERTYHAGYWQLAPSNAQPSEHASMSARIRRVQGHPEAQSHAMMERGAPGDDTWAALFVGFDFQAEIERTAQDANEYELNLRVLGVGSVGNTAVKGAVQRGLEPSVVCLIDTDDEAALQQARPGSLRVLTLGYKTCRYNGTGGDEEMALAAAIEDDHCLRKMVHKQDLVVVVAGLSGGTESAIAPRLVELAREQGALTVAVVAENTVANSPRRLRVAARALEHLRSTADCVVVGDAVGLQELADVRDQPTSLQAESVAALRSAILGVVQPVNATGLVGFDFADMKTIFRRSGSATVGVGRAGGKQKGTRAAEQAASSATLGSLGLARGVQILMTIGVDVGLREAEEAVAVIDDRASEDAPVCWQAVVDEKVEGIEVTVIAIGMPRSDSSAPDSMGATLPVSDGQEVAR